MSDIPENDGLNVGDVIDQGTELSMRENAYNVHRVRQECAPQRVADGRGGWIVQVKQADGSYPIPDCVDCEDPIPEPRLEMGRIRCTPCQSRKE
jgi:hypothetical protein